MNSPILLLGVGGAGGRLVSETAALVGLGSESVVAVDTDFSETSSIQNCRRVCIGQNRFNGLGTGGQAANAQAAAEDDRAQLEPLFDSVSLAVVATGLGGGAGSGMTPVLLSIAHDHNIPTLAVTLSPFRFESDDRRALAARVRPQIERAATVAVHFDNDVLSADAPTMERARSMASEYAAQALSLLWSLVTRPGYISVDIATLSETLRSGSGVARFAAAVSDAPAGERAEKVLGTLLSDTEPGLGTALASAPAALVGILGGDDLRLSEVGGVMAAIREKTDNGGRVQMGTVLSPERSGTLSVALLVFERWTAPDFHAPTPVAQRVPAESPETEEPARTAQKNIAPAAAPRRKKTPKLPSDDRKQNPYTARFKGTVPEVFDEPTFLRENIRIHVD